MSRGTYRAIHTVLIDGADYQALPPNAKLVLLTLKLQLGPSGIDVLYPAVVEEQTGLTGDQVMLALETLAHSGWIQRERNVVWIVEGLKHDPHFNTKLPKHKQGLYNHLSGLPRLKIVRRFVSAYPTHLPDDVSALIGEVSESHPNTIAIPSPDHSDSPGKVSESGKGKGRGKRERESARRDGDETPPAESWVVRVQERWQDRVGRVTYGQVGTLKHFADQYGPDVVVDALDLWLASRRGRDLRFGWFAEACAAWCQKAIDMRNSALEEGGVMSAAFEELTRPEKVA